MTKQAIFNKVYKHLLTQGRAAMNHWGTCMYLASDGAKCAVGCLISKKSYRPGIEGLDVTTMKDRGFLPPHLEPHLDLLVELQAIHDNMAVEGWKARLENLADSYGLKIPKV